jgi:hypothetical protein
MEFACAMVCVPFWFGWRSFFETTGRFFPFDYERRGQDTRKIWNSLMEIELRLMSISLKIVPLEWPMLVRTFRGGPWENARENDPNSCQTAVAYIIFKLWLGLQDYVSAGVLDTRDKS